jgi:glucokinase
MNSGVNNISLIGVDLGGTKVEAGFVRDDEILKKNYNLIDGKSEDPMVITNQIIKTIEPLFDKSIKGIGIGVPSLVNRNKGIVYDVQNIPSWKKVHLAEIIQKEFNVPVFIDNDANCYALGEFILGKENENDLFIGVTLGTGVGSGIISSGHLLEDANCGSGEFGSIPYLDGIYEDYCSGKFFQDHYNEKGEHLLTRARNREPDALKAYAEFGTHLGNFIKTIMYATDPKKISIGGSVAGSKEFFLKSMIKTINTFSYKRSVNNLNISFTENKNSAVFGAASLYIDRMNL